MLRFWYRFFNDLGCLLAPNLGPTWTPRWLWSCPRAAQEEPTDHPRGILEPRTAQKSPRTFPTPPREVPRHPPSLDFGTLGKDFYKKFYNFSKKWRLDFKWNWALKTVRYCPPFNAIHVNFCFDLTYISQVDRGFWHFLSAAKNATIAYSINVLAMTKFAT